MSGAPIANARAAALAMIRQLDRRDSFAVVSYSSTATTVLAMQPATDAAKQAARAALETIDAIGGTCLSCGLDAGAGEGAAGVARAVAAVDVVDDPAAVAASVDPAAMRAIEQRAGLTAPGRRTRPAGRG